MQQESLPIGEAHLILDADMSQPKCWSLAGGTVSAFSSRRPEKTGANEDAAAVISTGEDSVVLVVADGCGGMAGGEQASRIAVESLAQSVCRGVAQGDSLRACILDGVEAANQEILQLRTGAATTLAVVQIEQSTARPYHVGDAQILLVGGRGKVKLFTTSHSPVGYAVEAGVLDEREALDHEDRHLVSNVLGAAEMHVEVGSGRQMAQRDGLLVASDGVLDNLLPDEIIEMLRSASAAEVASQIAITARRRMEMDDATVPSKPDDLTLIVFSRR
jgi:serine/threonine protein phosphatase PrpC